MAGTFTHFIICEKAIEKKKELGVVLWQLLNKHSEFLFLGSVSPDLPYLSFKTGGINWADTMHNEKTNSMVKSGFIELREGWLSNRSIADEVKLAWLMGYVSHIVADATIHPIVQAIVGPYKQNPNEHRLCEMIQDSLTFRQHRNGDVTYAEFSDVLKYCANSEHFDNLTEFWQFHIMKNYSAFDEIPHPYLWFETYTKAIDVAEGDSNITALFRHAGTDGELTYKTYDEIVSGSPEHFRKYFGEVKLPDGNSGLFIEEAVERAVRNVVDAWMGIYSAMGSQAIFVDNIIKNWDLDTGENMDSKNKEITYWA